jgi:bifunctional non-homologous end joining protein LigD|uniref:DNA ligase (ATP) n=1 Tax=Desulfobacca acetoxidans TaxID=60893 RepID=A0A7C3WGI6_9BACT
MLDDKILPMLAYSADPFDSPRHLFEIKWDGTRCLLFVRPGGLRLQNRRLEEIAFRYPELQNLHHSIKARNAILDGELVVLHQGRPDFRKLQQREQAANPAKISLLAQKLPATYVAFDVLFLNDEKKLALPLIERKALLKEILTESPHLVESRFIRQWGVSFFHQAVEQGLEGIMGKNLTSPYLMGKRSRYWLKIKPRLREDCLVVGYTPGEGSRAPYFGALLVAAPKDGDLIYRGKVGSGFTEEDLQELAARLQALRTDTCPLPHKVKVAAVQWVKPELKAEIHFQELTPRGHFRAPVFRRLLP